MMMLCLMVKASWLIGQKTDQTHSNRLNVALGDRKERMVTTSVWGSGDWGNCRTGEVSVGGNVGRGKCRSG